MRKHLLRRHHDNLQKALEYHRRALEIHKDMEDRIAIAIDYYNIALGLGDRNNLKEAFEMLTNSHRIVKHEKETVTGNRLMTLIEKTTSQYNNKSKTKLNLDYKSFRKFVLQQLIWMAISLSVSLTIAFFIPFPYSIIPIIGSFTYLNFFLRKRALKKIGVSKIMFRNFSLRYHRNFLLQVLMWIGISLSISMAIDMLVPFPYDLLFILVIFLAINFFISNSANDKVGMFEIRTNIVMVYYCISCRTRHNETVCPKCGSTEKKAASNPVLTAPTNTGQLAIDGHRLPLGTPNESVKIDRKLNQASHFRNYDALGLIIQYPLDWKKRKKDDIVTLYPPDTKDSDRYRTKIWITMDEEPNVDLIAYVNETIDSYKKECVDFEIIESEVNSSLSGFPAYKLVYIDTPGDETILFKNLEVGTIVNNKAFYITYTAEIEKYFDYLTTAEKVIELMRIKE